jgi:hypothetical protein
LEKHGIRVVPTKQIEGVFASGLWGAFEREFPGYKAVVAVSVPGIADNGQSALLLVECTRGAGNLTVTFFGLKRSSGTWRIAFSKAVLD